MKNKWVGRFQSHDLLLEIKKNSVDGVSKKDECKIMLSLRLAGN